MISEILVSLLLFIIGIVIGYAYRDLKDQLLEVQKKVREKEPDLGATRGVYGTVNEFKHTNQAGEVGLVEAKTPQRVQFEAEEALRREARGQ